MIKPKVKVSKKEAEKLPQKKVKGEEGPKQKAAMYYRTVNGTPVIDYRK